MTTDGNSNDSTEPTQFCALSSQSSVEEDTNDVLGPLPGDRHALPNRREDPFFSKPGDDDLSRTNQSSSPFRCIASCCHCILNIPSNSPRSFAIIFRIVLPLGMLIGIAILCGRFLAFFEAPREYDQNDLILAERFILFTTNNVTDEFLILPSDCFDVYLDTTYFFDTGITWSEFLQSYQAYEKDVEAAENFPSPDMTTLQMMLELGDGLTKFDDHMQQCTLLADRMFHFVDAIHNNGGDVETVLQTPTFDWIRCWNETEVGPHLQFLPTLEQIDAGNNQLDFYQRVWDLDQKRLFGIYLEEEGRNAKGYLNALYRSARDATGRSGCSENISGAAWFWMTIMTTIGYGNTAPVTPGGRAMVASAGLLSILAFGGTLLSAGNILAVLVDDLAKRLRVGIMSHPLVGMFLWGSVAGGWQFFMGWFVGQWWEGREVDQRESEWDGVWWAFISTTTVGFGDFFLQPEVFFVQDLVVFAFILLIGFVFWSTFISKLSDLIGRMCPDSEDNLKDRVRKTNYCNLQENDFGDTEEEISRKELESLLAMLERKEEGYREAQVSTLYDKEDVLAQLLAKIRGERRALENSDGRGLKGMLKKAKGIPRIRTNYRSWSSSS